MVIPVARQERRQSLPIIVRCSETQFDEEYLGAVAFVPLIGEQGWSVKGGNAAMNHVPRTICGKTLPQMIADAAEALPDFDDLAFGEQLLLTDRSEPERNEHDVKRSSGRASKHRGLNGRGWELL
jgi:hypothetical protein